MWQCATADTACTSVYVSTYVCVCVHVHVRAVCVYACVRVHVSGCLCVYCDVEMIRQHFILGRRLKICVCLVRKEGCYMKDISHRLLF